MFIRVVSLPVEHLDFRKDDDAEAIARLTRYLPSHGGPGRHLTHATLRVSRESPSAKAFMRTAPSVRLNCSAIRGAGSFRLAHALSLIISLGDHERRVF